MDKPMILVIECFHSTPSDEQRAVLEIFRPQNSPNLSSDCCQWHIKTKYYEADVTVLIVDAKTAQETDISSIEALVVLFDDFKFLERANFWPRMFSLNPEIKVLTCVRVWDCEREDVSRWCLEHGFDLVETDPSPEYVAEAEEFNEKIGKGRIIEILQNVFCEQADSKKFSNDTASVLSNDSHSSCPVNPDVTTDGHSEGDGARDEDTSSALDYILQNFQEIQQHAESLPWEERRLFAERTVLKLWEEIGTDDDSPDEC
ncbi:unnamed protein product [Soboliphyme baturini]|uniref:Alpha-and gamma-adaptin-binding protein p34 n=1 Tax=Soboliphyme baturini TaxID=241478 RepID=A0A183J9H1_9BILA|nr:unnamed protein product [Soboliphyme baturini]